VPQPIDDQTELRPSARLRFAAAWEGGPAGLLGILRSPHVWPWAERYLLIGWLAITGWVQILKLASEGRWLGIDARVYAEAAATALDGGDPWAAAVSPAHP